MTHGYLLFSKQTFHTLHFQKVFKQYFIHSWGLIQELPRSFQTNFFQNPQTQEKQTIFWKHSEQVPKSPWITTDRKGANTFPFYNLPLETEKHLEKEFCYAFVLSLLEKIKDGGDSCLPRHFAKTNAKRGPTFQNSQFYSHRSQNWRLCWGIFISEVYLRIRSLCFQLYALYALILWACIGVL